MNKTLAQRSSPIGPPSQKSDLGRVLPLFQPQFPFLVCKRSPSGQAAARWARGAPERDFPISDASERAPRRDPTPARSRGPRRLSGPDPERCGPGLPNEPRLAGTNSAAGREAVRAPTPSPSWLAASILGSLVLPGVGEIRQTPQPMRSNKDVPPPPAAEATRSSTTPPPHRDPLPLGRPWPALHSPHWPSPPLFPCSTGLGGSFVILLGKRTIYYHFEMHLLPATPPPACPSFHVSREFRRSHSSRENLVVSLLGRCASLLTCCL